MEILFCFLFIMGVNFILTGIIFLFRRTDEFIVCNHSGLNFIINLIINMALSLLCFGVGAFLFYMFTWQNI